jgi:hypothetical protein
MGYENAQQLNIFDMFNVPQDTSPSKFELSAESTEIGEAWQYEMRKKYAKQEAVFPYWQDYDLRVSVSVVREISFTQAKEIIEKYEWLGCMPVCVRHCYGLFFPHKTNGSWLLGGVTVFSQEYAENQGVWDKYGYTGKIILLARGVNLHFCPKNANSHLIMESIKLLPAQYEVVTCTIDNLAGEVGTIYQACNFYYVGSMRKGKERVGCVIDGHLYGSRALRNKFGTQRKDEILRLYPEAQFVTQKSKDRYFYFRGCKKVRKENRQAIQGLIKPYPKRG